MRVTCVGALTAARKKDEIAKARQIPATPPPTMAKRRGPSGLTASSTSRSHCASRLPMGLTASACSSAPRDPGQIRRDADVDGENIVGQRLAALQSDLFGVRMEADGLIQNQSCPAGPSETPQIQVDLLPGIGSRQMPRQHAGIGRQPVLAHEDDAQPRLGHPGKGFQHEDMSMPAPDEEQALPRGLNASNRSCQKGLHSLPDRASGLVRRSAIPTTSGSGS